MWSAAPTDARHLGIRHSGQVVEHIDVSDEPFRAKAIPGGKDGDVGIDALSHDEGGGSGFEAWTPAATAAGSSLMTLINPSTAGSKTVRRKRVASPGFDHGTRAGPAGKRGRRAPSRRIRRARP
jgi:hypothetical protein